MKQSELSEILKANADAFEAQLKSMGPAFKKKTICDLVAGFKDGQRSAVTALVGAGHLTVEDDT